MTHIPFPDKKYDIIYADPAWDIPARAVSRGHKTIEYYDTMDIAEITTLPISTIRKHDSWLYLWTVDSLLQEALGVCKAWGFEYKKSFIWVKHGITQGLGYYNLGNHEQLLLAKRGKPPMPDFESLWSSVLECGRGEHSVKPMHFKRMIEEHHPNTDKIELFARPLPMFKGLDDGWDYWGNEA